MTNREPEYVDITEECPESQDGMGHCPCWWDAEACHWCGAPEDTEVLAEMERATKEIMDGKTSEGSGTSGA